MSTRCMIGIKEKDGNIRAIYCHHDGYPKGVGKVLLDFYKEERKVRQLLELGSISSLGAFPISEKEYADIFDRKHIPNRDMSTFIACDDYAATGGMEDNEPDIFAGETGYLEDMQHSDRAYIYLFKNGQWYINTNTWKTFKKLSVD